MKNTYLCPKCGFHRVLEIMEVAESSMKAGGGHGYSKVIVCAELAKVEDLIHGSKYSSAEGELEAWSCPRCGFSELYVKHPGSIPENSKHVAVHESANVRTLQARVESLELTLSSLMHLLHLKAGISPEEVSLMMQRLDLADGVEDGKIGPDATVDAPTCGHCGRPINPGRESCLFCNAPIPKQAAPELPPQPPRRTVTCRRCRAVIDESESFFSDVGLVCPKCFTG